MADFTSTRTAAERLQEAVWDTVNNLLTGFVSNDLMLVVTSILALEIIIVAVTWIHSILTMPPEAKTARGAFKRYKASRGRWDEPIYRKEYQDSLRDYAGSQRRSLFEESRRDG